MYLLLPMVFVQVEANRNQKNFHFHWIHASSDNPVIFPIVLHHSESTFCLDSTVPSQQKSAGICQSSDDVSMDLCKLTIQADPSVMRCFLATFCIRTAIAVLTFIDFFLTAILVALNVFPVDEFELLSIGTEQRSINRRLEINRTEWVIVILLVCRFFEEHGEFHTGFHPCSLQYR